MPKPQKIEAVKQIKERLIGSDAALLTEFRGLKVEELKELRRKLQEGGAEFKVVKNTLTRIAVREAQLEDLLPMLEGSTAIAFVRGDPLAAAKGLDEIARKYPALVIKGALFEGRILDAVQAQSLAKLRPREVLLAELVTMVQSPLQKMAILLTAPLRDLAYALAAYREKAQQTSSQSEEEPAPEMVVAEDQQVESGAEQKDEKEE